MIIVTTTTTTTYTQNVFMELLLCARNCLSFGITVKKRNKNSTYREIYILERGMAENSQENKRMRDWCFTNSTGKCDRGDETGGCMIRKGLLDNMAFDLIPNWREPVALQEMKRAKVLWLTPTYLI